MTLNVEQVTVQAGGQTYDEWEDVSINYALNEAARSFTLRGTERPGQFRFPPGTPIKILANGTLILDGYVNKYNPAGDATGHTVTIAGRSKSQDFIDSSAQHDTGYWENKTPDQIGQDLDKFGVGIKAEVPLEPVPYWQLYQGESPHRTVDRALRHQACTQKGNADGSISITNASVAKSHSGSLSEGINILQYSGDLSDDKKHSDYQVKGQGRTGHGESSLRPHGEAKDSGVKRYRPKILVHEADTDPKRAQKRADHEKNRSAGLSIKATITTQGWRDDGGTIWETNYLIFVNSPLLLKLVQPMLIESVKLDQGGRGSTATLSLVDPKAYEGKGGGSTSKDSGTDSAWG